MCSKNSFDIGIRKKEDLMQAEACPSGSRMMGKRREGGEQIRLVGISDFPSLALGIVGERYIRY